MLYIIGFMLGMAVYAIIKSTNNSIRIEKIEKKLLDCEIHSNSNRNLSSQ